LSGDSFQVNVQCRPLEEIHRRGLPGQHPLAKKFRLAAPELFHLRRHFADPDLCAANVAAAVGVSRRYLHRLYAEDDRSFREELIALRIEACLRALLDANQAEKTIAEIAFAAGYADISQFNRHFRRLKGTTPSQLRRAAALERLGGDRRAGHGRTAAA